VDDLWPPSPRLIAIGIDRFVAKSPRRPIRSGTRGAPWYCGIHFTCFSCLPSLSDAMLSRPPAGPAPPGRAPTKLRARAGTGSILFPLTELLFFPPPNACSRAVSFPRRPVLHVRSFDGVSFFQWGLLCYKWSLRWECGAVAVGYYHTIIDEPLVPHEAQFLALSFRCPSSTRLLSPETLIKKKQKS
jgi:hypothetical protein